MKILVTGGAGFIGSAVIRTAINLGHSVLNIDCLTYASCLNNLASVRESPNYSFEKKDIRQRFEIEASLMDYQPDAIMHLAAESHVDRSIDAPSDFIETNVIGTFNMLEAARRYWRATDEASGFVFSILARTKFLGVFPKTLDYFLQKKRPMIQEAHTQHQRLVQTTWFAPGKKPTACLSLSQIARTIMARINSQKSLFQ